MEFSKSISQTTFSEQTLKVNCTAESLQKGIHKHPHLLSPNPIKLIQRVSMNSCLLITIASLLSVHMLVIILTGSSR